MGSAEATAYAIGRHIYTNMWNENRSVCVYLRTPRRQASDCSAVFAKPMPGSITCERMCVGERVSEGERERGRERERERERERCIQAQPIRVLVFGFRLNHQVPASHPRPQRCIAPALSERVRQPSLVISM